MTLTQPTTTVKRTREDFLYDAVVTISPSRLFFGSYSSYVKQRGRETILGLSFNHRLYSLNEKNTIKKTIDYFDFDHLMFSIRPSSVGLLAGSDANLVEQYKDISQIIFALICLKRYSIPRAILFSNHLAKDLGETFRVSEIKDEIVAVLSFLRKISRRHENDFCSLFQIEGALEELSSYELVNLRGEKFISEITRNPLLTLNDPIDKLDKDIFWVGFDSNYQDVPVDKPYPQTKWTKLKDAIQPGKGLFEDRIRYCQRCCLPETMDGMNFDEFGICVPCRSSEQKMHINWENRNKELLTIFADHRNPEYYDCMLPMSGGKDSTFQAYLLSHVYKINALCVTHGHNWMSRTGRYNLENCLTKFNFDHLIFHPERGIMNAAARKSLSAIGDACWHCHIGSGTFTIQTAFYWDLKLMCWGESIAERDGRGSYENNKGANLTYNLEISAKKSAAEMVGAELPLERLNKWSYPNKEALAASGIRYLHLGDFIFWDEEKHVDFIVNNFEWREYPVENSFKGYKSVECVMAGVHDYANFIKRGIGRATVQAADDVRRGIITREEAFALAKEYDTQRPHALDYYLKLTGLTEAEFENILTAIRKNDKFASRLTTK